MLLDIEPSMLVPSYGAGRLLEANRFPAAQQTRLRVYRQLDIIVRCDGVKSNRKDDGQRKE